MDLIVLTTQTYVQKGANVTGVKPTILVYSFFSLFRIFKVAFKDIGAFNTNFTTAASSKIIHIGYINQFDCAARNWRAYVFWGEISLEKKYNFS